MRPPWLRAERMGANYDTVMRRFLGNYCLCGGGRPGCDFEFFDRRQLFRLTYWSRLDKFFRGGAWLLGWRFSGLLSGKLRPGRIEQSIHQIGCEVSQGLFRK